MLLKFYKYHGTGNDFIIINNLDKKIKLTNDTVKKMCKRHFGIGADGLMELLPSNNYDFAMKYYNSDGNEGTMCGNGGRCITAFAKKIGLISKTTTFEAIDGTHTAIIENDNNVSLKMNDVETYQKKSNNIFVLNTGSPHYVKFVKNLQDLDVINEGRKIRYSKEFKNGINVNFVEIVENQIYMRTYERGVENETLSCGTGTIAVAIVAYLLNKIPLPIKVNARGGTLYVDFQSNNNIFKNIFLKGPAEFVFEGSIDI